MWGLLLTLLVICFLGSILFMFSDTLLQKRPVVEHSPVLLLVALPYLLSPDDEILL